MTMATTPHYWDCECPFRYIHPRNEESCPVCHAHHDEQPDSRTNETLIYLQPSLINLLTSEEQAL